MIEIRKIDASHSSDINIPNEPFSMFGRIVPSYTDGRWSYELVRYAPEGISEMCFPDENYRFEEMQNSVFLGAYDGEKCVGLSVLEPGFFKYMYLNDLKVNSAYRRHGVGKMLINISAKIAEEMGYCGIYTIGQDNNPGACLFYLNSGFRIGGFDTEVYRHTTQEGKSDILFYLECGQ